MKAAISRGTEERSHLSSQLIKAEISEQGLKGSLAETQVQLESKTLQHTQLGEEIKNTQSGLKKKTEDLSEAEHQIALKTSKISELSATLEEERSKFLEEKGRKEDEISELRTVQQKDYVTISQLTLNLTEANESLKKKDDELAIAKRDRNSVNAQLVENERKLESTLDELESKKGHVNDLKSTVNDLELNMSQVTSKLTNAERHSEERERVLSSQLAQADSTQKSLRKENQSLIR